MPEIGATLREARMRERIDVSEIEATTKIRAKYLRALENEEWDLLPGPTFVKSFLRTYASALGLDGKALVEEYRLNYERPSEPPEPIVASPRRGARAPRLGRARWAGAFSGISGARGNRRDPDRPADRRTALRRRRRRIDEQHERPDEHLHQAPIRATGRDRRRQRRSARQDDRDGVAVAAGDGDGVCVPARRRRQEAVAGQTLEAGARTPTFHSRHFVLTLGNNAVTLLIDGTPRVVPASASAIGYSITKAGRTVLAPGHMPTCA